MKLKILSIVTIVIIIPWFGLAARLYESGHSVICMLVIFLPPAIVAGIILAYKHEVWKGKHPPR